MRDHIADCKKWTTLHEDWVFAHQAYLEASRRNMRKFMDVRPS